MGTEITLAVGGIDVDYSKNHRGNDHGSLFQEKDRKRIQSDQIDYDSFADGDDEVGELAAMEAAFVRQLRDALPRLELLGHTLISLRAEYAGALERWAEETYDGKPRKKPLTFSQFVTFATRVPVNELDDTYVPGQDDEVRKGRFATLKEVGRVPNVELWDSNHYSEKSYFGTVLGFLHPYSVLRLLAQNPANLDLDVVWQYGPLVNNGWASHEEFVAEARRGERFLIATEGSSDVHILKHAFALLRPEVSDFFHFVDVSEGHPFSGTGNLRKFAEGLAKIDVQNQTVFVFDNDAEGVEAACRVEAMKLPRNMRAMVLPDRKELNRFPILGPDGLRNANINGRAAAIETYLDLDLKGWPVAQATWSNFKKDLGRWHGALDFKESYVERFMSLTAATLPSSGYDTAKIEAVLDAIIAQCSGIASGEKIESSE